jgi:hypothetical protein
VVEVHVAAGHVGDVAGVGTGGGQRGGQVMPAWAVAGINLRLGSHAGVEEEYTTWVFHHVAEARLSTSLPLGGLLGRSDEVPEVHAPDGNFTHRLSIRLRRP